MAILVGLDLETESLDAKHDPSVRVWCGALVEYNQNETFKACSGSFSWFKLTIQEYLDNPDVVFVIHNAAFDVAVLRQRGINIPPGKYVDSMLLAYCADPGSDVSLKHLSNDTKIDIHDVLVQGGYIENRKGAEWEFEYSTNREAWELLRDYCEKDCIAAIKVFNELWNKHYINDEKLRSNYLDLELPYVECIIEMESTGMYVDQHNLTKLKHNLQKRLAALDRCIKKAVPYVPVLTYDTKEKKYVAVATTYKKGTYKNSKTVTPHYIINGAIVASEPTVIYDHCELMDFNPNSGRHLCWVLINEGWQPEVYSKKTSEPKTDKEVMETLVGTYTLARLYGCVQEYSKLLGTFVEGIEAAIDNKGFAHGSFNQCVTKTTRLSSTKPNLQNLPARSALGSKVRDCVIAPEGYDLVVGDLSNIEVRMLAYYLEKVMGESRMADAARNGLDFHQANADAWGVTRKEAKGGLFAQLYGAQAAKMAQTLRIPLAKAEGIMNNINSNMPAIQALKEKVWNNVRINRKGVSIEHEGCKHSNGVLYTLLSSRIFYPDCDSRQRWKQERVNRQSFNALLQGGAANVNKELTIRAMPLLRHYDCKLAFQVHDESGIYVPKEHTETVIKELNSIFTCHDLLVTSNGCVPVLAEFNKGDNWNYAKG